MIPPRAFCEECKLERDPFRHIRADDPVEKAKDWLYRNCPKATDEERRKRRGSMNARFCSIKYRAGIA